MSAFLSQLLLSWEVSKGVKASGWRAECSSFSRHAQDSPLWEAKVKLGPRRAVSALPSECTNGNILTSSLEPNGVRRSRGLGAESFGRHSPRSATFEASLAWEADNSQEMLEHLVHVAKVAGNSTGMNIVAFSGGVDSSLAAYLVKAAFPNGNAYACIGCSPALPGVQLARAREVAASIGIPLHEVQTSEGQVPEYVANEGASCFHCKSTLYSTLRSVAAAVAAKEGLSSGVVLFNGTNADDLKDPTRLGLLAALHFQVASPLATVPKETVRALARLARLPNWDLAASPCLRSRLDFGVEATSQTLAAVEQAEEKVRVALTISTTDNMRVRVLAGNMAVIELDEHKLALAKSIEGSLAAELAAAGLRLNQVRVFRSGSLSMKGSGLTIPQGVTKVKHS